LDAKKKRIVLALVVALFLAAVEGTIVTIAVPTIAKDLRGFEAISLIFSIYFLAAAVSTPLYGKLADLYGRKSILSLGITIFLIGSTLCGLSQSMTMLIICRAVQGLGAGSIFTVALTIVGDQFTLEEKPKVQGGLNAAWGIASLAGPFLGGFLIEALSWHWIFFINLPFGILSIVLLQKNLDEVFVKRKAQIDYAGLAVFSSAILSFLIIFMANDSLGLPRSVFVCFFLGATIILLRLFYSIEKKAAEPIVPFGIFTRTTVLVNLTSFLLAAMLMGVDIYVPIYIQDVLGFRALIAGLAMAPMSVAWLVSSVILGSFIMRLGGRAVILIAGSIILASSVMLLFLDADSPLFAIVAAVTIMGLGFGGAYTTLIIAIQSSTGYAKRGSAMAANTLFKTLGQTVGASILGSVFTHNTFRYFTNLGIADVDVGNLYASSSLGNANADVFGGQMRLAIDSALGYVYLFFVAISVLCLVLTLINPGIKCSDDETAS
jgi:EmrB/QacA subfamily drug resistance transporter